MDHPFAYHMIFETGQAFGFKARLLCDCRFQSSANNSMEWGPCPLHAAAADMRIALRKIRMMAGENGPLRIFEIADKAISNSETVAAAEEE